MKTPAQVLRDAAALVKSGWCQGASAKDVDGKLTDPFGPHAVAWCAGGAIQRIAYHDGLGANAALTAILRHLQVPHLQPWNDAPERTAAEVAAAMRKAADNLEAANV